MVKNFKEIMEYAKTKRKSRIAVAAADDLEVLKAIKDAINEGIAEAVLVGNAENIEKSMIKMDMSNKNIEIINEPDNIAASRTCVSMIGSGNANMVMKGLVDSATFLRAVLDKEIGLRTGRILSHVAVIEIPFINRVILLTDGAMNIAPDLLTKKQIIENAVRVANAIGINIPKVAAVCAVETVNIDMPATIDAAILSKMNDRGQIADCIVDGPLAVDNALSIESAKHKGIISCVAGNADIILVPNIESGNVMYKTLTYTSKVKTGGIIVGAKVPVILTSRADLAETKLYSIALASLMVAS